MKIMHLIFTPATLCYSGYKQSSSVCLSVCLPVTRQYCVKTAKHRITQTTPRDSQGTLVSWRQLSLVGDPHSFWNLRSKWPPTFDNNNFDQYPLIAPQPCESWREKVQLALIQSRLCALQRAIDEPCTLPLSPQRVAQNEILLFFLSVCDPLKIFGAPIISLERLNLKSSNFVRR